MLTYELEKRPGLPLYESLYRQIRDDILGGVLKPGCRLPSKRALAENLKISKATVEEAYSRLTAEGYLRVQARSGFYVDAQASASRFSSAALPAPAESGGIASENCILDLTLSGTGHFPFSVWTRLQREVILDCGEQLLQPIPSCGIPELRHAIAEQLTAFRGMSVSPEQILIGAGSDFMYNLITQLLGQDLIYAVEDPGYAKIRSIYTAAGVRTLCVPMDRSGVIPGCLQDARVLHISPSHHFPTGLVMPMERRRQLLDWASAGNWIIEDDYDSEFGIRAHPLAAMQSMAPDRVIYMNTFSRSLAPSIRIGYAVLPPALVERYKNRLGFYSCTVPSMEQYTLARFLSQGSFEKHINRMRRFYRAKRDRIEALFSDFPALEILEQDAGLHFLLRLDTDKPDAQLLKEFSRSGIHARFLSEYYSVPSSAPAHMLVISYAGLEESRLEAGLSALTELL